MSRGYTILLSYLHNSSPALPLETIQSALAHQLANVSPNPTPLAATAVSSPLYLSQPFTHAKLQSLSTAFRHATHLKYRALVESFKKRSKPSSMLGRSLQAVIGQWVTEMLKGVQGGHPVLRLASCTGLLLGVEDLRVGEKGEKQEGINVGDARSGVEDEAIVALAEVMDNYAYGYSAGSSSAGVEEWEKEFQPAGRDILSLSLILASQSLPLASQQKLKALPLPSLLRALTLTIASTFKHGTFLSSVSASVTLSLHHHVHISPASPVAQILQSMSSSPLTTSIPSISRFTATILSLLVDVPSTRLEEGMSSIFETLDVIREMAKAVERDWISCPLASCTDFEIADDSKEITKAIWTALKTFLFSIIVLAESVLSGALFVPPDRTTVTPAALALQVLNTLSHLSFVISEFGGVTTTTQGFEHLKKTFYLALDILAQGEGRDGDAGSQADAYVQQVCFALNSQRSETAATKPRQAKQAFALASIEQLVPVLSDKCIRDWVWGVCYPHLSDPSHRETHESAHSVILAIFASHAQHQLHFSSGSNASDASTSPPSDTTDPNPQQKWTAKGQGFTARIISGLTRAGSERRGPSSARHDPGISTNFAQRMVPFYAQCLIENSVDGKLNTSQLRLAYSALVRSASASAITSDRTLDDKYVLAWYCVQLLLDAIHALSPPAQSPKGKAKGKAKAHPDAENDADRLHRLHLMLISTVSSLPLTLMLRVLEEIRPLIMAHPRGEHYSGVGEHGGAKGKRMELLEALFGEILEKTGDREKEAAMRWWYKYRPTLLSGDEFEGGVGQGTLMARMRNLMGLEKKDLIEAAGTASKEEQADSTMNSRL